MFLREHQRKKDGKEHNYWSLVETVRTPDGPPQRTLCYLGELNSSAQACWLKTIEVFNEQGEKQQLKLFPSQVEPPPDDPQIARVLLNKGRLERARQFGAEFDVLLYDLTSTYVEGVAEKNPMMRRGYSRDHRPDCEQMMMRSLSTARVSRSATRRWMVTTPMCRRWKRSCVWWNANTARRDGSGYWIAAL